MQISTVLVSLVWLVAVGLIPLVLSLDRGEFFKEDDSGFPLGAEPWDGRRD